MARVGVGCSVELGGTALAKACSGKYAGAVLTLLKRTIRRFFPRRTDPTLDAQIAVVSRDEAFASAYARMFGKSDDFVRMRYDEGLRWRTVVRLFRPCQGLRVLDVGAGNGAVELAFAADPEIHVASVEMYWNEDARRLFDLARRRSTRVVGTASSLPFKSDHFDVVTCLETLEHLRHPTQVANEISRVTRRGGLLLVTTPSRWRYVFRPDPHFALRGLAALPAPLQRWVAARKGYVGAHHYVDRLYGSVEQVRRVFDGFELEAVLSRSRAPERWFWDALLFRRV